MQVTTTVNRKDDVLGTPSTTNLDRPEDIYAQAQEEHQSLIQTAAVWNEKVNTVVSFMIGSETRATVNHYIYK